MLLSKKFGFDVEENDIEELLQSHCNDLSNENLLDLEITRVKKHKEAEASQAQQQQQRVLSHKLLSKAISKLKEVLDLIEENNPDVQRSLSVSQTAGKVWMLSKVVARKQRKTVQMTITSFFKRRKRNHKRKGIQKSDHKEERSLS